MPDHDFRSFGKNDEYRQQLAELESRPRSAAEDEEYRQLTDLVRSCDAFERKLMDFINGADSPRTLPETPGAMMRRPK